MKPLFLILSLSLFLILESCSSSRKTTTHPTNDAEIKSNIVIKNKVPARVIDTKNVPADELVTFAESLQGVPYKYGSSDAKKGLDCSGFINYVFNIQCQ